MADIRFMNSNMAAAARFAAAFGAFSASNIVIILDAILVASIFVVLSVLELPVLVSVLSVVLVVLEVLVRIIIGLVAPSAIHRHSAKSQT